MKCFIFVWINKLKRMDYSEGYSGLAIADYFVDKCLEQNIPVTNMAILKMIYFAHGLAYPELNIKLIKDPFYTWPFGPVEVNTYENFKIYGAHPIISPSGKNIYELNSIKQNSKLLSFLNKLVPLAKKDPFELSKKSHEKGGPWDMTNVNEVINDHLIERYFKEKYGSK